jgi:hypothetical protein
MAMVFVSMILGKLIQIVQKIALPLLFAVTGFALALSAQ